MILSYFCALLRLILAFIASILSSAVVPYNNLTITTVNSKMTRKMKNQPEKYQELSYSLIDNPLGPALYQEFQIKMYLLSFQRLITTASSFQVAEF